MNGLPSPAPSPPITESKKRTRSTSESTGDSPSSPKRAVSEAPSASSELPDNNGINRATSLVQLTNDLGIDQYMATQDQAMTSIDEQGDKSGYPTPPPHEKLSLVQNLQAQEMQEGETWWVISHSWFRKWEQACSGKVDKDTTQIDESSIPPVDNSDIADADGNLIVAPAEGINADYVPSQVWDRFVQWYGTPIRPLSRTVITQGVLNEKRLELFPLKLRMGVVVPSEAPQLKSKARSLSFSKKATVASLVTELNRINSLSDDPQKARYWLVQGSNSDNDPARTSWFTASKLTQERGKLLDTSKPDKTLEEALIEHDDIIVLERQVNNEWQINETPQASRSVTPLFGSGSGQDFFSKLGSPSNRSTSSDLLTPKSSGFGITRHITPSKPPGLIGLVNLGNTCFMASALQGLAHEPELTEYFLTGLFREELNIDNPLGMQGAVAESFGALLSRLWVQNSTSSAYSPREFKQVISRFAPSFSGYQQQDAQEFLAFLLDGLHEDLNRIIKKPYVEKPEWEGGGSRELMQLAQKSWEGYMQRNDSVIVDLFQGQYKSTLICPECSKVSITFDPFMYLTLPLPITKKWKHIVYFVPWDLHKPHVQVPLELSPGSSFKDLKQLLGQWLDIPPVNLLTLEVWSGKFYKNLNDGVSVQEITNRDTVVCFELPCNAQQARDYQRSTDDPLILPVFHSIQKAVGSRPVYGSYNSNSVFGNPLVIVIPPGEGTSVRSINEAVVERLSRWTVHDLYTWEGASSSQAVDHVIPLTNSVDTVTEIRESGEVVTVEETDITEMATEISEQELDVKGPPKRLGPKSDIFSLKLHHSTSRFAVDGCDKSEPMEGPVSWKSRLPSEPVNEEGSAESVASKSPPSLLRPGDWLVCEWDVHMQAFYFGSEQNNFEHSRWRQFDEFLHPEYTASVQAQEEQKKKSLNLEDCLDEFTKEEQLGEDDLWYCPRCKKHQRATKKFDIWKVPDILVVHLKRFSSSRILRDKIDALVDFPLEGLDLERRVGERELARSMQAEGLDVSGIENLDEPLLYDLFSVTEHRGGLGGGHYRAYAKNHLDDNWYHFDDTHVYKTEAQNAVNESAYLLFYRRRATEHLGGKTHEKVKLAREKAAEAESVMSEGPSVQLPTPPAEGSPPSMAPRAPQPLPLFPDDSAPTPMDTGLSTPDFEGLSDIADDILPPPTISFIERSANDHDVPGSPASSTSAHAGDSDGYSSPLSPFRTFDHLPDLRESKLRLDYE